MNHSVVRIDWIESERGWGQRPDGYSLHLNVEDCERYVDNAMRCQAQGLPAGQVPDEYSATVGRPYLVDVDDETFNSLLRQRSVRVFC